jgi:hypothetical protein
MARDGQICDYRRLDLFFGCLDSSSDSTCGKKWGQPQSWDDRVTTRKHDFLSLVKESMSRDWVEKDKLLGEIIGMRHSPEAWTNLNNLGPRCLFDDLCILYVLYRCC